MTKFSDLPAAPADPVEWLAADMWIAEAMRAAPNVGRTLTREAFADELDGTRQRWLGLAQTAYSTMRSYMASDGVTQVDCDVCHGSGKNNSHQLWPGCPCRYCNGTGKLAAAITPQPDPRDAEIERLREDAEKWRGLMACQRIRRMGGSLNGNHIGIEFWINHPAAHPSKEYPQEADREGFGAFARAALAKSEGQ